MSDRTLDELWGDAQPRRLAPGDVLFRTDDPVRLLHRMVEGEVMLVRALPHGAELVLQRARAGAILAEASLFAAAYHCDAVATAPCLVRSAPVARIKDVMERRPELAQMVTRHLAAEVQRARARAEIVSLKTVAKRLDAWLALNDRGLPARGRWRDVAAEIGVSPEALYRELARRRRC